MKVLATLGPMSLNENIVNQLANEGVDLFRINLSHTELDDVSKVIKKIQQWTDIPVCIDTEGAQIRTQRMSGGSLILEKGSVVKIHHSEVLGDSGNISFTPSQIAEQFEVGDLVRVDFNGVSLRVIERGLRHHLAIVEDGGSIGSNKAVDVDRELFMEPITPKDYEAIQIALDLGVRDFSLSFANSVNDVYLIRDLVGKDSNIISKIESIRGVLNLDDILEASNQILIDRGDLSRQVAIEKIPLLQRIIIRSSNEKGVPVYVATNLLESMIISKTPTRAEVNDVISTLLMGADGLVLAAETAIGHHPVLSAKMIKSLGAQVKKWDPNASAENIINSF